MLLSESAAFSVQSTFAHKNSKFERELFYQRSLMPKKVMKKNLKTKHVWPMPKRGKARALKRPVSAKAKPQKVPYVKHGKPSAKSRPHRARWNRSVQTFLSTNGRRLIHLLQKDNILPKWHGKLCPKCGQGVLGPLHYRQDRDQWVHRCSAKKCQARIRVEDFHPIFYAGSGSSKTSLELQAATLFCAVSGVPRHAAHLILDVDHKVVEKIYCNNEVARARYVKSQEALISYGGGWKDLEADEVDLGKGILENPSRSTHNVQWEQWAGILERGRPESLRLFRLNPAITKKRAPGPGAIRKRDWKPIATKLLSNKEVVLHTDGARAYALKLPKVFHCNVVHKKKKAKINGKVCWLQPQYTKVYTLKLPDGKNLKVKSGTQTIDRFWRHLREELKGVNRKPGNQPMTRKIRSAQWTYWHKGTNLWEATGKMIQTLLG